ncbi:DNA-binding NarL/FixJ family response regulator [Streptosporangium becharense]|uniref:DNA-binding NarL/FixJ family response regulator n=1 Tax=Streptosporangium becharense TaxID=1816182 RepID=A0A7W9IFP4_9ACTN|nr:response regulator transcription factor [Streptosporangium becharense]MBB2909107.1 DNA-binding NarL/FixJ family response regulator [Streptosporangium becharense]MBB5819874.1 DNA-binding NarL/FixJ family response regulator [Streptosporangium becharense]
MTISVALVDDEAMIRVGLRMVLSGEPDIEVVGEASDGAEALALVARTHPDVVLIDVRMPHMDGLEASRRLVRDHPDSKVIVLTTFDEDAHVAAALRAGVSGFLLKVAPPEHLVEAVRTVAAGGGLLDPAVTLRVIAAFAGQPDPAHTTGRAAELDALTGRETDVLKMLAQGLTNTQIAARLHLGEATVKTHLSRVLMKLDLTTRVQAVVFAYESGLVRPGEERRP